MEKIIEVEGLKKSFGTVEAVKGIDFYVQKGHLFAFLGPNGAGKSTTINMICTLLRPDGGKILVSGHALGREDDSIRRKIGVVFQESVLDPLLTVRENLVIRGSFYGLGGKALREAVNRASKAAEVESILNRPYGKLSGGQRRRVDIARALVNTPEILFLDEPTTGLDPKTRQSVWNTIRNLQQTEGMTVFLTTHYMEEAAKADYVAVIVDGKLKATGTPAELREAYSSDHLFIQPSNRERVVETLVAQNRAYEEHNGVISVQLEQTTDAIALLDALKAHIAIFEVVCGSMDDAFIAITGEEEGKA